MSTRSVICAGLLASSVLGATSLAAVSRADAQTPTFPASGFEPVRCGGGISSDPHSDQAGANNERDIVGADPDAALYATDDGEFLYLRLRVDGDAERAAGGWEPFGWGFEFDTDGDLNTYEFLLILDGVANPDVVRLMQNTVMTAVGDPSDRAEVELASYPASTHAFGSPAASTFGADPDFFIDIAVPLADLEAAGLPLGSTVVWAGSSANGRSLSQDLVCHDGATGAPNLADIASDPFVVGTFVEIDTPAEGAIVGAMPTISGRAEPGASVMVFVDGVLVGTVVADASGVWTLALTAPLAEGAHTVTATTTDADGLTASASTTFQIGTDSDGDGIIDAIERPGGVARDTDADGTSDHLDTDDDGDGVLTATEAPSGAFRDSDGDGTPDHLDTDDDGDFIPTATERTDEVIPADADGIPAYLDLDSDADGSLDRAEGTGDANGNGLPDYLDPATIIPDADDDGIPDTNECPAAPCRDTDLDTIPNRDDDDDDGDGIPTYIEIGLGVDTDTDGDGIADYLDPDDDGDGIPTAMEAPGGRAIDTDGDGTPDYLDPDDDDDGILTLTERGAEGGDVDGDGIPNELDTDSDGDGASDFSEGTGDADGDGIADYLDPDSVVMTDGGVRDGGMAVDGGGMAVDGGGMAIDGGGMAIDGGGMAVDGGPTVGGLSGGAVCSTSAPGAGRGSLVCVALLGLALLARRRRAVAGAVIAALVVVSPGIAAAQSVHLDQFRPAETAEDGFAVSRPDDLGHLRLGAQLYLDHAVNPLVYESNFGDASTESATIVEHQLALHAAISLGLFDRLVIFAGLPVNLLMSGGAAPAGISPADGTSLGDVLLGARARLFGERNDIFALGVQLTATFPTARAASSSSHYAGEEGVTIVPELLAELRPGDGWRVTANLGARLRASDQARFAGGNLDVSHELTWGLGLTAPLIDRDWLTGHIEVYGASTFENFGARATSPIEAIAGLRLQPIRGLFLGLAVGTGITRGYGSPDLRGVFTIGWAEPVAEAQVAEREPAPTDRDHDGIIDDRDACPDEPEDIDSFEDEEGCPDPDNDRDGVLDVNDGAPNDPEDPDGFEDTDGVPDPDNDQDGVPDVNDGAPNDPEDRDGFQDADGVPEPDNDRDTVLDPVDQCPLDPGRPEENGCPRSLRVDRETGTIVILQRVEFATNSDVILDRSFPILQEVHAVLGANPELRRVRIEGHTDDRGRDDRNLELSRRRAASVRRWLVEHGIAVERLEGWGCGELHPAESNTTAPGRQANRRVEFLIIEPAAAGGAPRHEGCVEATD